MMPRLFVLLAWLEPFSLLCRGYGLACYPDPGEIATAGRHIAVRTALVAQSPLGTESLSRFVYVESPSEVAVTVRAGCTGCAWGDAGREAAALRLLVDGKYSQHVLLYRGEAPADYRVSLGTLAPGRHRLTIERDPSLSARGAGRVSIDIPK